jgi:hypothetical protein
MNRIERRPSLVLRSIVSHFSTYFLYLFYRVYFSLQLTCDLRRTRILRSRGPRRQTGRLLPGLKCRRPSPLNSAAAAAARRSPRTCTGRRLRGRRSRRPPPDNSSGATYRRRTRRCRRAASRSGPFPVAADAGRRFWARSCCGG